MNIAVITTHKVVAGLDSETKRKMINQYIVFEELGRGMHGKVRRGWDTDTEEDVVR
jgi:hypothetical protein